MTVSVASVPEKPVASAETRVFLHIDPPDGPQLYLGVWAHVFAAGDDLIDLMHTHPFAADGGPEMEFRACFARERTYRVWFQFQRQEVINTVYFDVPVSSVE